MHYLWSCHNMNFNFTFYLRNHIFSHEYSFHWRKQNPSNIVRVIYFMNTICLKNTCNIDIGTIILSSIHSWISKKFHPVVAKVFFHHKLCRMSLLFWELFHQMKLCVNQRYWNDFNFEWIYYTILSTASMSSYTSCTTWCTSLWACICRYVTNSCKIISIKVTDITDPAEMINILPIFSLDVCIWVELIYSALFP